MKIGMMTFHASLNCGSMLQAYALQNVLINKYGQDAEIIDFSSRGQRQMYSLIDTHLRPRVLKKNLRVLPYLREYKKMQEDYHMFSEKYLRLTPKSYKKNSELFQLKDKYDVLIAGGDQVWNVLCRDADLGYFLNFSDSAKKIAYSPSLGAVNINKAAENPEIYRDCLQKFDSLSVREPNGKKWLEELLGRSVEIVADPTLLLTPEEWKQRINIKTINTPYIFYYAFSYSNEKLNMALQNISRQLGVKVFVIDRKEWNICKLGNYGIELYPVSGPEAFLTMINSASYVVTDSFHGTVFSALFNKRFCNCKQNVNQDVDDDRSSALLKQLGLSSRYVLADQITAEDLIRDINYETVNEKISEMRKRAYNYLEGVLGVNNECV